MDENIRNFLSQIQIERMELKSSLHEISYLLRTNPNINLTKEIDKVLDRLKYLEELEKEIRKHI